MAIVLKIKFDPLRGSAQSYDFISPALRVDDWASAAFTLLESTDNITYTPLTEGTDWRADFDWANDRLRLHILKDYSSIIYIALASASARNIAAAYNIQGPRRKNIPAAYTIEGSIARLIPVSWNTGAPKKLNIASAYNIRQYRKLNIPVGFYQKDARLLNVPIGYGISGAVKHIINVSFHIGTLDSGLIAAGAWIMGVARLPSEAVVVPPGCDPAASRVKGCTKEVTLSGTEWEDLD